MKLVDRVKAAFTLIAGNDGVVNKLNQAIYSFFSGYFYTLTTNKKTYVDEGYRKNLDVYSIVKLISGKAANAKFKAVRFDAKGKAIDLPKTDWVSKLLVKPNNFVRQQQFLEECASWLLLTGDLYLYKVAYQTGPNKGKVNQLWCLPSQYTQIIGGGMFSPIEGYKLIIGDQAVHFTKDEVVHIRYFNPEFDVSGTQLYGQSPLEAALKTVQSSNEGTNAKIKAFINGGMHGLLSSKDPNQILSVEQVSQLKNLIEQKITGSNNSMGITPTNGLVEYQQIGMSPADLQILQSLQFDANALCKAFGVDPILFSVESASYNNKKEAYKALINNSVVPLLNLINDALNEVIMDSEKEVVYDISHFPELQTDLKEQVDSLKNADWLTPNEKREKMGLEKSPMPEMDNFYVSSSVVPIDEVGINVNIDNSGDF